MNMETPTQILMKCGKLNLVKGLTQQTKKLLEVRKIGIISKSNIGNQLQLRMMEFLEGLDI